MFTILTAPTSWKYRYVLFLKKFLKRLLWVKTFWPNAVIESIVNGLKELSIDYTLNPIEKNISEIVYVPLGIDTLKYALELKKTWRIQKLIVWPNISIPESACDIFFHPLIDHIIVPSLWLQNYFFDILGKKDIRISIIPAWVDDLGSRISADKILIYKKDCSERLFQTVCSFLDENVIDYEVFIYGKFLKKDYVESLSRAKWLIYLQASESQWIALHEAWMKDVPTLVWNRGYWEYSKKKWYDKNISAPYLTKSCGEFFLDEHDFKEVFYLFFRRLSLYSPREYSLQYFTHKKAISNLLIFLHK